MKIQKSVKCVLPPPLMQIYTSSSLALQLGRVWHVRSKCLALGQGTYKPKSGLVPTTFWLWTNASSTNMLFCWMKILLCHFKIVLVNLNWNAHIQVLMMRSFTVTGQQNITTTASMLFLFSFLFWLYILFLPDLISSICGHVIVIYVSKYLEFLKVSTLLPLFPLKNRNKAVLSQFVTLSSKVKHQFYTCKLIITCLYYYPSLSLIHLCKELKDPLPLDSIQLSQ